MGQALRRRGHRAIAGVLSAALCSMLVVSVQSPARAAQLCANPGTDGAGTPNNIVDTYLAGTANVAAGATTIAVSAHMAGDANKNIAIGDLLLVIQMQGGTWNTANSSSYGDGSGSGSGATSTTAGTYEYVVATAAHTVGAAGSVSVQGTNGGGLIHSYTATGNGAFQVIRVPQYSAPTAGPSLTTPAWNGSQGGVFAIDVAGTFNGNGQTISVSGKGFRGGGARQLTGDATAGNGDWVNTNAKNAHGQKGEGTMGTPNFVYSSSAGTLTQRLGTATADGYTGGDMARGAPGNAGGGGADSDVSLNQENSGGGGGGNGGAGGVGGKTWQGNLAYGGHGGTFTPTATQLVMGGGGGAGSRNNSTGNMSSGGSGGAMVMIRANAIINGLTVTADGMMGVDPDNDGGGGGGAGGSVSIMTVGLASSVTANANGANGTDADILNAGNAAHGPGGGGGGGVVVSNTGITTNLAGGAAGVTDGSPTPDAHYGASAGTGGTTISAAMSQVPGASSGAECNSSATNAILIGPVGVPNATGSYDGNVTVNNNNDFVEKSFAPNGFVAINSSTTVGSPNGNTYGSATTVAVRHEAHNYGGGHNYFFYATAPVGWTVAVYTDNAGSIGTQIAGTASGNQYQTTSTINIAGGASYFVWTQYSAPASVQAFNRYDAVLEIVQSDNTGIADDVHDELYSGYVVQTKSYSITATNCSTTPPAGSWCPGATLSYTVDVRNIALPANGTEPASAILSASNLTVTDDGGNTNSWAKDGGYMNTPGVTTTGIAPTTITYYYNATSGTAFPVNYSTTNKVTKFTANWSSLAAGANGQLLFGAIQF